MPEGCVVARRGFIRIKWIYADLVVAMLVNMLLVMMVHCRVYGNADLIGSVRIYADSLTLYMNF